MAHFAACLEEYCTMTVQLCVLLGRHTYAATFDSKPEIGHRVLQHVVAADTL